MAVTSSFTRQHSTFDASTFTEFITAALSGTYITGGFTWNPFSIFAGKGSNPLPSTQILTIDFVSPLGYSYRTTLSGNTATTKIFTAPNTEFTTATAVPDAAPAVIIRKRKI